MVHLALALLLLPSPALAGKKEEAPEPVAFEDPWSQESLDAALAEVKPLVEKAAGRPFTSELTVELLGKEEQLEKITHEIDWMLGQINPETDPEYRKQSAASAARGLAGGALGKYGIFEKVVYLNQQGIDLSVKASELPETRRRDAIKLILTHEIGHALEDQVVGLKGTVEDLHDAEHLEAASATWEGLATWIEGEVARELGIEDVFWKLNLLQGWGPDGLVKPAGFHTYATYGQGYVFIGHHASAGGPDRVWEILDHPPASTSQIWRPDTYDSRVPLAPRDYSEALRGTEQKLTKGDWLIANTRIGETSMRAEAFHTPEGLAALDEAVAHLVWAQGLDLDRTDREGEIRIMEFDSPESARAWLSVLREQRVAVNAHAAAELGVSVEVLTEPFPDVEGDDAVLRIERIPIGNGRHLERHQAWVVRGPIAVVVTAERFRPGLRLGWTVEEVFKRLDSGSTED